jgi:DNA-binding IclR family transcriptional regulator
MCVEQQADPCAMSAIARWQPDTLEPRIRLCAMTENPNMRVYAVERALMLLQCFESAGEQRTLASLARHSGLYKSTTLRLASSLCRMGFLQRDEAGLYTLGPELMRLASLKRNFVDVEEIMRDALRALTVLTQETASFFIRHGSQRICLYRENSPRVVRHYLHEGERLPLNDGAAGQIIRAYSRHAKSPELAIVRRHGWAVALGDSHPELAAIAAPVFNREKELLGALTISGPLTRFGGETVSSFTDVVVTTARDLAKRLGLVHLPDLMK